MKQSVIAAVLLQALGVACQAPAFNITAIWAKNNASRLECWQLDAEPQLGRGAVNFGLGEFGDSIVGIIPPKQTSGTLTNAVAVQ